MRDVMNRNAMAITGTPALATGALTVDTDQALQFNGTTNSGSVPDSTSLSITSSMSVEFFLKITAFPGVTKSIIAKSASYTVQINSAGKVQFKVENSPSIVTVTQTNALTTNVWYHFVCVYNGNYAGTAQFGKTSAGATDLVLDDTESSGNNKAVSKFTLPEAGILNTVTAKLQFYDEIWPVRTRAIVYADAGGVPTGLITSSAIQTLNTPTVLWRTYSNIAFPLTPVLVPAGNYNIGLITDTSAGPTSKPALQIGLDTSGGDFVKRPGSVDSPEDPFGTPVTSNDDIMAIYCDYTATERTGREGTAAIYVNGAFDASGAYVDGIVDNANAVDIAPSFACYLDEITIWNRALTDLEVATHYNAH